MAQIPTCFAKGTRIRTAIGYQNVEDLRSGDTVLTYAGKEVEVRWIGVKHVVFDLSAEKDGNTPIQVQPAAFGPNLPSQKIVLSAGHCVLFERKRIPVGQLLHHPGVDILELAQITYYHVEVGEGELDYVMAEGLPCESYVDTGNRIQFDNYESWQTEEQSSENKVLTALL